MKKKYILYALLGLFVIIQFFRIDKTNPTVDPQKDFLSLEQPPAQIASIFKNACYDCHSHSTQYPWYTNIAPVSWWIKGHIDHGREHLNFANWGDYDAKKRDHKLEETAEEVLEKHMPFKSYTWFHPTAKLSDADRQQLADWVASKRQ